MPPPLCSTPATTVEERRRWYPGEEDKRLYMRVYDRWATLIESNIEIPPKEWLKVRTDPR